MPSLYLSDYDKKNKDQIVAIVKGDNKHYNNKLLYVNEDVKKDTKKTKIEIPDGCLFSLCPSTDENKRDVYYIAGASGAGKSYLCKTYIENYQKLYPERPVYLISKLDHDDTLDEMNDPPIRLNIDDFILKPFNVNDHANSLWIFDDYDAFEKKPLEVVTNIIDQIATMGRKHVTKKKGDKNGADEQGCISMICISHHITNYKKTSIILNESTHIVVYPHATNWKSLKYICEVYMGIDPNEVKELRKLQSRWVCFYTRYPRFMVSQQFSKLLNTD